MASKFLIIALIVGTVNTATWLRKLPEKPKELAHKEGCYIEEIKDVVPFGSSIAPLGYCYTIYCSTRMIDYASCGVVSTNDPKCYVTDEDLSKPHPQCCRDIKCDIDNNLF